MLFINLQLVGDLSTYYTWACALDTHTNTHTCTRTLPQFVPPGILRRHTCATALVAGAVMAVLKGWERARPCQTADGWTHGLHTHTHTHRLLALAQLGPDWTGPAYLGATEQLSVATKPGQNLNANTTKLRSLVIT